MAQIETVYSPYEAMIANMFGTGVEHGKYGYQSTGPVGERAPGWAYEPGDPSSRWSQADFADPLFTPDAMADINEYLSTPLEIGDVGQWGRGNITPDTLAAQYGQFQDTGNRMVESLNEGLDTGWAVDIDPIVQQALSQYYGDIVPQTVENFAGTTGISSSGFGRAMESGARRLATDIGAFDYAAQEAAAGRRAGITPQAGGIMSDYLGAPLQYGADIASYDQMLANIEKQAMPGAPLMEAFTGLGQDSGGTTVVKPPETDDTAATAAMVGDILSPT